MPPKSITVSDGKKKLFYHALAEPREDGVTHYLAGYQLGNFTHWYGDER